MSAAELAPAETPLFGPGLCRCCGEAAIVNQDRVCLTCYDAGRHVAQPEAGWRWYGAAGPDPEIFWTVEDTREAVIAALAVIVKAGETFTITEARKGSFPIPSGESLLEHLVENADGSGEYGEEYPELLGSAEQVAAAEADLGDVIEAWSRRHSAILPDTWAFAEERNRETLTAAARATGQ